MNKNTGLKRDITEKFYTNNDIVLILENFIKKYVIIDKNDLIIEPSAGNGSFLNLIKKLSNNYIFYDLYPENKEIIKQDFLILDTLKIKNKYKTQKIHIIGNPPFGRQSSLAIKFIKKCCLFSDSISFILPKSFKKESNKKKFDKYFHLIFEIDLPENSFNINNKKYNVPCIFQIWIKKNIERKIPKKIYPNKFKFVKKNEEHDISFRRVGVYAGKIDIDTKNKSIQSHYFIKFENSKNIEYNLNKLKKINFEFNNTVGPKSISKQELIKEFNKYI